MAGDLAGAFSFHLPRRPVAVDPAPTITFPRTFRRPLVQGSAHYFVRPPDVSGAVQSFGVRQPGLAGDDHLGLRRKHGQDAEQYLGRGGPVVLVLAAVTYR